jgi:hypothetical protein
MAQTTRTFVQEFEAKSSGARKLMAQHEFGVRVRSILNNGAMILWRKIERK